MTASPQQVRDWIAQSIRRSPGDGSEPDEATVVRILDEIGQDIAEGHARLWVGAASAVVTQPVIGERVWHAGGDMVDLVEQMKRATGILRANGVERLTIEHTRKGWAKALRPYGFTPLQGLEVAL